jgi:outer membrane protein OmpA-like peptidoglycan-associated protein
VDLRLSPIIEADPAHALLVDAALASAARQARLPAPPVPALADPAEILVEHVPVRLLGHSLDVPGRSLRLLIASGELDLAASRQMELDLRLRFPGWTVQVIPPAQGLPAISFGDGSRALDAAATRQLDLAEWALKAWGVEQVLATGYASGGGRGNARLAGLRAQAVAEHLQQDGIAAQAATVVATPGQRKQELELGRAAYRRVLLSLAEPEPVSASGAADKGATQ